MKTITADAALANSTQQHSLARPGTSIETVAADLVGLHNTTQVGPYLSARARLPGFDRAQLDSLMWDSWDLVRFRAMRLTMFVFPRDLLEIAAAATRRLRESLATAWLRESGLSPAEFEQLAATVDDALTDGPRTTRSLRAVPGMAPPLDLPGIVSRMCDRGRLVGGAPPGSWRSSIRRYHRWSDVLPEVEPTRIDEPAAVTELVRRYVRSYGPVTIDDISWWTGLTKSLCRQALAALDDAVEEVTVADWPGPLVRLAGDAGDTGLGDGVTALPLLDPYVQGYRDRERLLDPDRHGFVWDGGGNAAATLVHRGRIIGVWQVTNQPETVCYHPFATISTALRRDAETDLAAAGALYFGRPVDVVAVPAMEPLAAGGGRSAAHPLDGRPHRASRRKG